MGFKRWATCAVAAVAAAGLAFPAQAEEGHLRRNAGDGLLG